MTQTKVYSRWNYHIWTIIAILCVFSACSVGVHPARNIQDTPCPSTTYNQFAGGVLVFDVNAGLDLLWNASFCNGRAFRENVAFIVHGGLLILPNQLNTVDRGKLGALPLTVADGKLFVDYEDYRLEVLAIVHTHPDVFSLHEPAPGKDYQFGHLGLHNYVMDWLYLFDAYEDSLGRESYLRLGPRTAYDKIPRMNSGILSRKTSKN